MFCSVCELERGPDNKFCPECGKVLSPLKAVKICQKGKDDGTICGQVLQDGVKFCPSCGTAVEKISRCRRCNTNLYANASFCQNCREPVSDTKEEIPAQDIKQNTTDLVAPSEERNELEATKEEEFGSIPFIDADDSADAIPKEAKHDERGSQSDEEEWFDAENGNEDNNTCEEEQPTQDSPCESEGERKHEHKTRQLQQTYDEHSTESQTPQKDSDGKKKIDVSVENVTTETKSEGKFQHVEMNHSEKPRAPVEQAARQHIQPQMGIETDVDSYKQSIIYQTVDKNWIRIHFHALIAQNMKFQPSSDSVVLHMWAGTVKLEKPMRFEGTHLDAQGVAEVKCEVVFHRSDVLNQRISYKYFVERKSTKSDGTTRRNVWGCLYGNSGDTDKRYLNISKSSEALGYWHQYDGFIYKKSKAKNPREAGGIMKSIKSGYEYVTGTNVAERDKDAEIVLRVFGNQIANMWSKMYQLPHLVEMMKSMSLQLLICTGKLYSNAKNWRTIQQQVNQSLWKAFTDCYKSLQDGRSDEDIKRKICLAIAMLSIRQLTCTKTDEQALQFLCSCFLVHTDISGKCVREYDVLLEHFIKQERDELKNNLVSLVSEITCSASKDPSWWYLLPILHFLSGVCSPFEEVSTDVHHSEAKPFWWGLMITEEFYRTKSKFTFNLCKPKIPLQTIIRKMKGLFSADYYLPRSIVASLTLEEIGELLKDDTMIPHEVFFAAIYFFMKTKPDTYPKVTECLDELLKQVQIRERENDYRRLRMMVLIVNDMLYVALAMRGVDKWWYIEYCTKIYLLCMAHYDEAVSNTTENTENVPLQISLEDVASFVIHGLDSSKRHIFEHQIDLWDRMLYPGNFPVGRIKKRWNKAFCVALTERIEMLLKQSQIGGQDIVSCYCKNINSYQQPMQKFMASLVSKVLGSSASLKMTDMTEQERNRLRQLMLETFNEQWLFVSERNGKMDMKVFCDWANLPLFLSVLATGDISDHQDRDNLNNIITVMESSAEQIISGSILIGEIQFVSENTCRFLDLLKFTKFRDNPSVATAIAMRTREKCLLDNALDDLENLKSFCSSLENVDLTELDDHLKLNLTECKLSDIIVAAHEDSFANEISGVQLVRFTINNDIEKAITCLHKYKESLFFKKNWEEECAKQQGANVLALTDIYQAVVVPVLGRIERISLAIVQGSISFTKLETEIGSLYPNNLENLQTDLATICDQVDHPNIETLVRQIRNYRHVVFMRNVAKTLISIRDTYDLKGDFGLIEDICKIDLDKLDMATFSVECYEKCSLLADIKQEEHICLQAFSKCSDLVMWLRKSMGDAQLKELKVFVDLAMMSAGDDVEKSDRVQCLLAAVTGFSSLIFELHNDGGIMHFLQICQPVWQELRNTENLHTKLEDASRYIQWFQNIRITHGAVEFTSFMQVETINEHGVYMIGKSVHERFDVDFDRLGFDDVKEHILGLLIPASSDGKREAKQYKFSELQDLQSRLMLVGGESEQTKQCIDRFSTIFDGVLRLCNIYEKLVSSGCVLFRDFSIQVYCNPSPDRPVCFLLEFKNGTHLTQLKCHKTSDELIENMMPKVATKMEGCLLEWLNFVKSKRTDFPHLNIYTTDQLVILQKELADILNNREPSSDLFPLLQLRKNKCSLDDVKTANMETMETIQREDLIKSKDDESPGNSIRTMSSKARETFIQKLNKAGYKDMIPYALDEFENNLKPSTAIAWCLSNKSRIGELKANYREKQLQKGMTDKYDTDTSCDDMIASAVSSDSNIIRCDELIKKFDVIWKKFLESASSNLRDYISLKHLGIFLEFLGKDEAEIFQRRLPPNYNTKAPNLIICPSHELLQATVSLYMTDQNQLLPQADEVVTCSTRTSVEEVDIFLRRAVFSSNGKIHCLVHADLLSYYVWEEIEKKLADYLRNKDRSAHIGLVIICSSENEHTSAVISSLDAYRREYKPLNDAFVSSCIAEKLKDNDNKSASSVDIQSLTVRVIRSKRSGVGKTLYKKRKEETLKKRIKAEDSLSVTLSLHGKHIDIDKIIDHLRPHARLPGHDSPRIIHIDVANEVYASQELDYMLFNLLILGRIVTSTGLVWKKNPLDLYLIERREIKWSGIPESACQIFRFLPYVTCLSPQECLDVYEGKLKPDPNVDDQLFDQMLFESDSYQKTYIYLKQVERGVTNIHIRSSFRASAPSKSECLKTLLSQCRVKNPSWSELYHFVLFLRTQLADFESNVFVSDVLAKELPGFSTFVLKFLLQMSQDFSSRSLNMSEENVEEIKSEEDLLKAFKMKRTWESSPHPYIFFNADGQTFTFLGFYIDSETMDLMDQQTNEPLERFIMRPRLYRALLDNQVPIQENFDHLDRSERIERLCRVMGMPLPETDPDETYELTTDNAKKIMAIYMRFRCDIPVIVMGETGCGKTRLVKFMCDLMNPKRDGSTNMIIMKVHGGTNDDDIKKKVEEAEGIARQNRKRDNAKNEENEETSSKKKHGENIDGDMNRMVGEADPTATENEKSVNEAGKHGETVNRNVYTVLFFDEANTTESIGLIKEIMCDKTMDGKPLNLCENLKFVAACNPYRRHPKKLIKKLEKAGLGYAHAEKTTDVLGRIAMRQLVYRVQPLPQSLLPFVWDFGQLNAYVEKLYIVQMVKRYISQNALPDNQKLTEVISTILAQSQEYMRGVEDECCFVSLRDVDRVLQVMCWFLSLCNRGSIWFTLMDKKLDKRFQQLPQNWKLDKITRCLVLALGVCYQASLTDRDSYRKHIENYFREPCQLPFGQEQIRHEIDCCQEVILENVNLEDNIAQNLALKENVFMMVVCIELRIPLFLVGKPGSSKSLAKVVVTDAMQGNASYHPLFKELKQVQMVSFQCSPLATPQGIVSTFRQCAMFQREKNLDTFVSAVVLDEIGLAEDSPSMPLKTLHPLLEYGYEGDDTSTEERKVAFIGISNWSLDPAKMNRGIFVQRDIPDSDELEVTAKGICTSSQRIPGIVPKIIKPLAAGYLEVFDLAIKSKAKREFFGLRDFYCLMKMINRFVDTTNRLPSFHQMVYAIQRNFSGLEFETDDIATPLNIFMGKMSLLIETQRRTDDPSYDLTALLKACLTDKGSGSRHMLLLTENYNALATFQQKMLKTSIKQIVIFGSSFRRDQEYTQVCRNINRIKLCMETGYTVILLNSESLYESLYDALNQYYVSFGGKRFVDLGLGRHRVKCPVHDDFKLIIVAEKQEVYKEFPIPLINRLEKHILTSNTLLSNEQNEIVEEVKHWAQKYVSEALSIREQQVTEKDIGKVFIGYHEDACSAIVLDISENINVISEEKSRIVQEAKETLIWCSTPDAVVRLGISKFPDWQNVQNIYWEDQAHESIAQYLHYQFKERKCSKLFAQVTTHGKLLVATHRITLSATTGIPDERILLLESLTAFDTEQQFNNKIRKHLDTSNGDSSLIIIQCESGDTNANLIACARYSVLDECEKYRKKKCQRMQKEGTQSQTHVLLIIQMPTKTNGNFRSIQCGDWHSAHIDHLLTASIGMPRIVEMQGRSVGSLVKESLSHQFKYEHKGKADESEEAVILTKPVNTEENRTVDLKEILSMCTHGAMSRVRDAENNGYRTTQRISLLLLLLQKSASDDPTSFLYGVSVQISRLLEDKETNTSNPQTSDNWLAKTAASQDVIQKTGTLRRACLHVFGSVIMPILSGLVAFLDTNQNLNMLHTDIMTWQNNLWLTILKTEDAIPLSYRDMFPDGNPQAQCEFHVVCTGSNGKTFQSKMPFSWLIRQKIEDILRRKQTLPDLSANGKERYDEAAIFAETPIGLALACVPQTHLEEMVDFYIHDFIHMEYTFEKENEYTVVCQFLKLKTLERAVEKVATLTDVHVAYKDISNSLRYFREINHTWDQCSKRITDSVVKSIPTDDITIEALYFMVEDIVLKTEKYELAEQEGRLEWLNNVHRCRHIVQQTLAHYLTENEQSDNEKNSLLHIRSRWNRVVVLQLFLEDVCTVYGEKRITVDISMALWMSFEETDDMKNIETLKKLEDFLSACFKMAKDEYKSKAEKCSKCETALHGEIKRLNCGDTICVFCRQELLSLPKGQQKCFTCKEQLPDGWEDFEDQFHTDTPDRLQDYQKRCNTFFMDVVSQLCFYEGQAPSEKVVDRLMNYSLQYSNGTENLPTGVDPDDAFKAFILKHLIRINEKGLKERIGKYLNELQRNSEEDNSTLDDKRTNLLLLVVCSIEDNLNEGFSSSKTSDVVLASEILQLAYQHLDRGTSLVDKIYGVAYARTGLIISAKKYFIRCIFNIGGMDVLLTACKTELSSVNWIYNENVLKDRITEAMDMYLCCGDAYMAVRQGLMEAVREEDADVFMRGIQQLPNMQTEHKSVIIDLAVHREITLPRSRQKVTRDQKVLEKLSACFSDADQEFTKLLMRTDLEESPFQIDEHEPDFHVSVKCLIFHWNRVLFHANVNVLPIPVRHLRHLAEEPGQFTNAFLPTMHQDDLADLRDILQKTAQESNEYSLFENPTIYICPNGHPYEVRDCGRPSTTGTCLCGATIGGMRHILHEDNSTDTGVDRTELGHILGDASSRSDGPVPERSLSRLYCASTRMILHLAMLSSCCKDKMVIRTMIKPPVAEDEVSRFLFDHLLKDLEDLQLVLNCNVDDVLVLFHHLANSLMQVAETNIEFSMENTSWLSKEGRTNWEKSFAESVLKPLFEESQSVLAEMKIRLQGSNALLRMVAEAEETESSAAALENLEEDSKLWIYRAPITLQSLTQEFERKTSTDKSHADYQFLNAFLSDVTVLQAIRFVPSILKLHRALMNRYCYKLYRTEATSITVGKLREDRIAADETDILFDDTIKAWDIVRKELKGHVLTTEVRRLAVPREISEIRITDKSPISILLPSSEGQSLCTYAMLDLLVRHQNDILEKYKRIYGHSGQMSSVLPRDLTLAHVVSFDPQYDVQPLILANCTLHMENVTVEYDFGGIERQLVDRFISTKSIITLEKYLKVDMMVYRTDMKDAESLENVEAMISQEELDGRYATQICSELADIPSLCRILEALDITISFLNITGGNATRYLNDYMEKTLEMDSGALLTQKIQQICQLRHIKSLWMNLSFKKSFLMIADGKTSQDVFEIIPEVFHLPLPDDQYEMCHQFLRDSKDDDLNKLLEVLFTYLVLHLTRRERENDAEFPLQSCLEEIADQYAYPAVLKTLQSKHSAQLWTLASQVVLERQDEKQAK